MEEIQEVDNIETLKKMKEGNEKELNEYIKKINNNFINCKVNDAKRNISYLNYYTKINETLDEKIFAFEK
jgi:hypothetical protein